MAPPLDDSGGASSSRESVAVPLLRPKPQRAWQITPLSTEPPTPARSPSVEPDGNGDKNGAAPVPRSRSILNLTSPTLFGIYKDDGSSASQPPTPWGQDEGALTPATPASPRDSFSHDAASASPSFLSGARRGPHYSQHTSHQQMPMLGAAVDPAAYRSPPKCTTTPQKDRTLRDRQRSFSSPSPVQRLAAVSILAALGLVYGLALAQLHASSARIIPIRLAVLDSTGSGAAQLAFWSLAAVAAGVALPALDRWWWAKGSASSNSSSGGGSSGQRSPREPSESSDKMISFIRCVGGFVGIAFAIRKLPCEATVQAALTLTLSNPILWYLVDGSLPGLLLALATGLSGAGVLLSVQPALDAPSTSGGGSGGGGGASLGWATTAPAHNATAGSLGLLGTAVAPEALALAAYVGTALFYAVVGFGNVGRALAYR